MVTHADIFSLRDKYLRSYQSYLTGLSGVLFESLNDPSLPSPAAKHEHVVLLASRLFSTYTQTLQPLRDDIHLLVGFNQDQLIRSFVVELSQELISALTDIAHREARNVSRLALEVLMGVAYPLSARPESLLSLLEQRMRVMDTRGRRWRSERYAAILMQSTFLKAVNESTLYLAKPNARFRVVFQEPEKAQRMISLEDYRHPDTHDSIFHPNSSALVIEIT